MIALLIDPEQQLDRVTWGVLVRMLAGDKCERCKADYERGTGRFAAHHRNGVDTDNRVSNGELLCCTCHRRHHNPELRRVPKSPLHNARVSEGQKRRWAGYSEAERKAMSERMSAAQRRRFDRERRERAATTIFGTEGF